MYQIKLKMELFDAFKMELLLGWRSWRCHHDVTVYIFVIRDISFIKLCFASFISRPYLYRDQQENFECQGFNTKYENL